MIILGGIFEMKTRILLVNIKCIILLCLLICISSCATYKQDGFPTELLGTWFSEFSDSDEHFYIEQAYIFNLNRKGTIETRQFSSFEWGGETHYFYRNENVTLFDLYPSYQKGIINIRTNNSHGQISYKIKNGHLLISGISNKYFDQSNAKYRKLSDTEVEKWINADGKALTKM